MKNSVQSIRRPVTSQNYRSIDKLGTSSQQRLPNLSDVMNLKLKQQSERELQEMIQNLVKQVQQLNSAVTQKDKQIQQYEFMIQSLQIAIEKRDCIISALRIEKQQIVEVVNPLKPLIKTDDSSRTPSLGPKKSLRTRTKDTNFDENLSAILDADYALLSQYVKCYEELNHLSQIKNLVSNEDQFFANIQKMELSNIVHIFDAIQLVLQEHKLLFKNVIKLNKLFDACLEIYEQTPLNDQLENLQGLLRDSLNCDKAQIYVLDNEHQELWTKNKDRVSRIQVNEDIIGACFQERNIINVHNAYNDPRFKKENDKGYKTNTILLCPILDKQQNSIGVIVAINKLTGHFNNDDQLYISKTSEMIQILLRNHQQSNESISIQNALRNVIHAQIQLTYLKDAEQVLFEAENLLKNLFHTQKGLVYIVNNNRLLRVNEKRLLEMSQLGIGIVGEAHRVKEFLWVQNAYNHQSFNNLVDIQTTMPVYCIEVQGKNQAVILQVINNKGIRSQKVSSFDQELLEMFVQDLFDLIYAKIFNRENVDASLLSKLQTQIFLYNLEENLELDQIYFKIIRKHINENNSVQEGDLKILLQIVYYLGVFINKSNIFTSAFQIIKENLIDKHQVLHQKLFLHMLQACGAKQIGIQQELKFVNLDSNTYFQQRFLQPYIQEITQRVPNDNIINFIKEEQNKIKELHPESEDYVMSELKLFIIQDKLKNVNFNENQEDIFELFNFLQVEDEYQYQLKAKIKDKTDKRKNINPFYQLALLYKEYLNQYIKLEFYDFLQLFKKEMKKLKTNYQNEKHLLISLKEFIEEYLFQNDVTQQLFETEDQDVGYFMQCSSESIDHFIQLMIKNLFQLVAPKKHNFNFEKQILKVQSMAEYHHKYIEQLKLQELKRYMVLSQKQQNNPLFVPFPNFISQTVELIEVLPKQLEQFIPQQNDKKYQFTIYGYGEVLYNQRYLLVLSTRQLVSLCHLINSDNQKVDEESLRVFSKVGLIKDGNLNERWEPKNNCLILFN